MADTPLVRLPLDGAAARSESVIDRASYFTGTFRTAQNLRIEGKYEGEIECAGAVFVAEGANVNARIVAGSVIVAGQCQGEIVCEARFEILSAGRVSGSVSTGVTVVHEGAFYEGEIRMTPGRPAEERRQPPPAVRPAPEPVALPQRPEAAQAAETAPAPAPSPRRRPAEPASKDDEPELPAALATATAGSRANGASNGRTAPPLVDGAQAAGG
ncbi:MAG: polymer-forming cytoskeletal protein [Dehalococcoidia bacterium]